MTPNKAEWPEKIPFINSDNHLLRTPFTERSAGYNEAIDACNKWRASISNVSPHKLYEMANGDTTKYIELMLAHGYIIPKEGKDNG